MIVYSALSGNIDKPREDGIKCFSDYDKFVLPVRNAKIYKILPHLFFNEDKSLWIDANIGLTAPAEEVLDYMLGDADIGLFKHPYRDDVYKEGLAASGKYPDKKIQDEIFNQLDHYKSLGVPEHGGLYECGVLARRHSKKVEDFCNAWWAEICRHSFRDQLSFPYILSKFPDIKVKVIEGDVRMNKYFTYKTH